MSNSEPSAKKVKIAVDSTPPSEPEQADIAVPEPESIPIPESESKKVAAKAADGLTRKRKPIRPSKPRTDYKFWVWAAVTGLVSAGLVASAWPATHRYLSRQSNQVEQVGESSSGNAAALDFRVANLLSPSKPDAAWHYAAIQLDSGDAQAALATLNRAVFIHESAPAREVRVKAELEIGKPAQAAVVAQTLTSPGADDDQLALAALALGAAGQGRGVAALVPRVSSPAAVRTISQAAAGKVALAQALSSYGLVRSATRVLLPLASSAPRDLLLARIGALSNKKADLTSASLLYASYIQSMPADSAARLEYSSVLDRLKRTNEANTQRSLASDLKHGRP